MKKKSYIYGILFVVIVGISFAFYKVQRLLFLTDLSTHTLDRSANPDYNPSSCLIMRDPVYLITYADGPEAFFQNQHALAQSALGRGVDFILNYRRSLLDPHFIKNNYDVFSQKRGAGYWLWKPWIILDALKNAPENAIIIYCDCGSVIKSSLRDLIDLTQNYHIIIPYYDDLIPSKASARTKREVFIQLQCDRLQCYDGPQLWAGFIIFRNTARARQFVEQWLNYAQNKDLLMDGPSSKPELPGFKGHHHDQSILNVLYARNPEGIYLVKYYHTLEKKYLTWKHRRPHAKPEDPYFIYESLLPYYGYTHFRKVDRFFINSSALKRLRHYFAENYENINK